MPAPLGELQQGAWYYERVTLVLSDDDHCAENEPVTPLTAAPRQSASMLMLLTGALVAVSVPGLAFVHTNPVATVWAGIVIVHVPPAALLHLKLTALIAAMTLNDVGPPPAADVSDHATGEVMRHVTAAPPRVPEQPAHVGAPVTESPGPTVPETEKVVHETMSLTPAKLPFSVAEVPVASVSVTVALPPDVIVAEAGAATAMVAVTTSSASRAQRLKSFIRASFLRC